MAHTLLFLWFKGLILGFTIAAPVGPIGLLCMGQTLNHGWRRGMATGLGVASADGVYGCIAAFGLTALSGLLMQYQTALRILGGLFLSYLGVQLWLTRPPGSTEALDPPAPPSLWQAYSLSFGLTLTNPITVLLFLSLFTALDINRSGSSLAQSLTLVLGVICGSSLWWLSLATGLSIIRHRLSAPLLLNINRGAGTGILLFGVGVLLSLLRG